MPPSRSLRSVRARTFSYQPIALNVPVIGLILAFATLLLVCICICCCSYRKTAKRNERYQQRRSRADRVGVGFTQLNTPLINSLSNEGDPAATTKPASWSAFSQPPAYATVNPVLLVSPHIPEAEWERLLPTTPMTPRAPSPPPPTYSAAR